MLTCEGYKMFHGVMRIEPVNLEPYTVTGVWLYKPEYDCWYCGGRSYPAEICKVGRDKMVEP